MNFFSKKNANRRRDPTLGLNIFFSENFFVYNTNFPFKRQISKKPTFWPPPKRTFSNPKVGSLRRLVIFFCIFGFVLAQEFQSLWGIQSLWGWPYEEVFKFYKLFKKCTKKCLGHPQPTTHKWKFWKHETFENFIFLKVFICQLWMCCGCPKPFCF